MSSNFERKPSAWNIFDNHFVRWILLGLSALASSDSEEPLAGIVMDDYLGRENWPVHDNQ